MTSDDAKIAFVDTRQAVFRDLAVGRTYTVAVGGAVIGRVLVVDAPGAADGLIVRATASPAIN